PPFALRPPPLIPSPAHPTSRGGYLHVRSHASLDTERDPPRPGLPRRVRRVAGPVAGDRLGRGPRRYAALLRRAGGGPVRRGGLRLGHAAGRGPLLRPAYPDARGGREDATLARRRQRGPAGADGRLAGAPGLAGQGPRRPATVAGGRALDAARRAARRRGRGGAARGRGGLVAAAPVAG